MKAYRVTISNDIAKTVIKVIASNACDAIVIALENTETPTKARKGRAMYGLIRFLKEYAYWRKAGLSIRSSFEYAKSKF